MASIPQQGRTPDLDDYLEEGSSSPDLLPTIIFIVGCSVVVAALVLLVGGLCYLFSPQ